jgi:2-aminoadipate transaminase
MQIAKLLAHRTNQMRASTIREILKVVSQPGIISLAGGIPAPASFPVELIPGLIEIVLSKYGATALQYDLTEGFLPLRQALSRHLFQKGIKATADEIYIASGSQGILDAVGKALISKGDAVAVESPTYLGAIQAFAPYEPEYIPLETDDHGLVPASLDRVLSSLRIKFVYSVPTFQNPSGRTLTLERRERIAQIIRRHDALLIEDDPYSDLRYQGEHLTPIKVLAPNHVVYISTLSKVFAPGLRIGFYLAPKDLREWLVIVKQGVDLHTSTLNQAIAAEYLSGNHLDRQLPEIIRLYKPKKEAMLQALDKHFPNDFKWSKPEGGMFLWAEGPKGFDAMDLYHRCVAKGVVFVPGKYFFADKRSGLETMRLNFTMVDEEAIDFCIQTMADTITACRAFHPRQVFV